MKIASDQLVYEAKRAAETLEFGCLSNSKDCRENAFKLAKQMKAENQDVVGDPCIKNDAGCMAFSDDEKLRAWKEHYQRLLNEEFEWDANHLIWSDPVIAQAPQIHQKEIAAALAKMKVGKAAGSSGVVTEMLKASGEDGLACLEKLFNGIILERKIPTDWDKSVILNCFKGKGDAMDRGNYRGLKLLEHPMKLFERVIEQHIRSAVNINEM